MVQPKNTVDSLPFQLGIRLVLDSVSYTNPLPDWFEAPNILYGERERVVKRRINSYLGQSKPEQPLGIFLPRKSGDTKLWAMPSVNDQIICQVCVSAIAEELVHRCIDSKKVFSYRYKTNPDALALCEDPISSWRAFQRETTRRCNSGNSVLQIDLEDAFHSIDRAKAIAACQSSICLFGRNRSGSPVLSPKPRWSNTSAVMPAAAKRAANAPSLSRRVPESP